MVNRLILFEHMVLYVGASFDTSAHLHHAGQLCIGLNKPFQLFDENDVAETFQSVLIPANTTHRLDAADTIIASLYLDIQSINYELLLKQFQTYNSRPFIPFKLSTALINDIAMLCQVNGNKIDAGQLIHKMMSELTNITAASRGIDPRITEVLHLLNCHFESQIPLQKLANKVNLSEGRLAHLFKAEVGTPIRRYSLWRRIRVAMEYAIKVGSLTEGSHYAGFTDSAHFSRIFKQMYGINPSSIINRHFSVEISFG